MKLLYRKRCLHESQRKTLWWQMFFKISIVKNLQYFTEKHMCWSLSIITLQLYLKETPTQMFSCEISQICKNTFFTEHLRRLLLEGVCEGASLVKISQSCHLIYLESVTDISERCPLNETVNGRDCWNVYCFSCSLVSLFSLSIQKKWS